MDILGAKLRAKSTWDLATTTLTIVIVVPNCNLLQVTEREERLRG